MRSLLSSLLGRETADHSGQAGGRPEILRRQTLVLNSGILLLASLVGAPPAIYLLAGGVFLPFVIVIVGLAAGFVTLAFHRSGQFERAAAGQVYAMLLAGVVLTISDMAIADFGLAVALLAPVHASLLARSPVKKRTWAMLVVVVGLGCASALGFLGWPTAGYADHSAVAAIVFAVCAFMVALSGNRLNSVFEVYEKAQVNAYRHLVENVQDAVMRFGADGSVLFTSKSAERLFGCRRYELTGSGVIDRIHVLDRPAYMNAFADANRDSQARSVEVRMRRDEPDEPAHAPSFFWAEIALSPVIDPDTPTERHEVVALLRDVSVRRDADNQMREARRFAEEASSAKSRFLATIGHELRTPLNAIVGFSEMMTSGVVGDLSPAHLEYANIIHQSGHHLLDVVKMLLDMSRIEAGKFELQTESFEPKGLIEPCFQIVDKLARDRHVRLMTDIPRLLPTLVADERACRQILINLLSNAIKFSHEKGAVIVSMKRQGGYLNISVADRGIGMDSEAVGRLGEPFFQVQDGLSRRYEGTGLGLSIVKGLVDLHQGSLQFVSAPGEGTTIAVLLPLNGPETKMTDNAEITTLHREPAVQQMPTWQDEKRKAL